MKRIEYYVDMDGVLAVWNEKASEEETHQKGYFAGRDMDIAALSLVRLLKNSGKDVMILSSVYQDDHSAQEKREWLNNAGLPDIKEIFVPYGEDKYRYIKSDETTLPVLIDDYGKNLVDWENQGYFPVKYFNGVNNQPKLDVIDGSVHVKIDSWYGASIDSRMTPEDMYKRVTALAEAEAA